MYYRWPCDDNNGQIMGLRSSGLPDEGYRSLQPVQSYPSAWPPGGQDKPCQCKKHSCGPNSKAGMKYIQPAVPVSYKPEARYKPPDYRMESGTIYRLSYPGADAETIQMSNVGRPKGRPDNIKPSSMPLSQDTTFRLSFTGVQGERACSYKPTMRYNMMGNGPMQSITTQRHDFTPKVLNERPPPIQAVNNIHLSSAKMEDNTTMRMSYQPVEGEKVQNYKPISVYRRPEYKLEQDTVNRLSYQPWEPLPKEDYPWRKAPVYQSPVYAMENNTIYRASYLPNTDMERAVSYKPMATFKPSSLKFADETIYRESYQNAFDALTPVEPIVKPGNIALSSQPMSQDTTFRLSYTGVPGERAVPHIPVNKRMMGSGPIQSITTQRHDFTPKPIIPTESFRPKATIVANTHKMEDTTTFRASYLPNDPLPRVESYKPIAVYKKPTYGLESDTINRLSYQPWVAGPKEDYPWMKKQEYQQPSRLMEGTTVYRGSYIAPGEYVPDGNAQSGGDEGCTCRYNKECSATDDL